MKISVNGKQIDVGDSLRSHVGERLLSGVRKYFEHPIDASVTFSRAPRGFRADCQVRPGGGLTMQSHAEANDPYNAFDGAAERMEKRLRRYKRRLKDHRFNGHADAGSRAPAPAQRYVLRPVDEAVDEAESLNPVIIAEMATEVPSITVGEAVMRMDLAGVDAYMFNNSAHGRLNVVYRRTDGNIGWIDSAAPRSADVSGQ